MDSVDPFRFLFAFVFVLGLIGVMAWGLRRYSGSKIGQGLMLRPADGGRLQVVEMRHLDPRRKLVLVRRDDTEHLLLLSDGRELVVEQNIQRAQHSQSGVTGDEA